jgi:hypothetical protein
MDLLIQQVDEPGKHHLNGPYSLLAGFAFELAFKAILRAAGQTDRELRRLSHDLRRAYDAAIETGFHPANRDSLERVVAKMQAPHANFLMRYIPVGIEEITIPHPGEALETLTALLNDIEAQYPRITDEMPH